jgi:hypothetical protein
VPLLHHLYANELLKGQLNSAAAFQRIDSIAQLARQAGDRELLTETAFMHIYYRYRRVNSNSHKAVIHAFDSLRQVAVRNTTHG